MMLEYPFEPTESEHVTMSHWDAADQGRLSWKPVSLVTPPSSGEHGVSRGIVIHWMLWLRYIRSFITKRPK